MKAAVLHELRKPVCIEEVPTPEPGPHEVLVETRACGVCRTDLHVQDGLAYLPALPHIPGHEPAGVVVQVGAEVRRFKGGERVVPYLFYHCGTCRFCRSGREAQCANLRGIFSMTTEGAFAEYFVVPETNLLLLPDSVSFPKGGLVSCAVITAVHASRRAKLRLNDRAVVIGCGGIGQLLIQILKKAGVKVAALDLQAKKVESAQKLGADLALPAEAAVAKEQILGFSGGEGVQCVFDCVGASATLKASADYVMRGGRIVVLGEEPESPPIDSIQIAQRELEIVGSRNGSRQDAFDAIDMLAGGLLDPPIDRAFPLEAINEAFAYVRDGRANGRVVVTLRNEPSTVKLAYPTETRM